MPASVTPIPSNPQVLILPFPHHSMLLLSNHTSEAKAVTSNPHPLFPLPNESPWCSWTTEHSINRHRTPSISLTIITELDSIGWYLRDIYINQTPNRYSPESLNRYTWSSILLLWILSMKEDLFIHQLILSHFALSMCSCSCRVRC